MDLSQLLGNSDQTLGGRYKLIRPLSQGGFGDTFLATDLHFPDHPTCVIKQLKSDFPNDASLTIARRLFETEAQVLSHLGEHTCIPRLLAHFESDQQFYLAQELIEGDTLSALIQRGQAWTEDAVLQLLVGILNPLAFVHAEGVIHRDLKPSNLIRRHSDGCIVLIDFGSVKQVLNQSVSANGEVPKTIAIGTQGYMPVEQLAGKPWFASDVYAAGMICLQALTGKSPRSFDQDPLTGEIFWPMGDRAISDKFRAVLSRMVRSNVRDRYPTATAVLTELNAFPNVSISPETIRLGCVSADVASAGSFPAGTFSATMPVARAAPTSDLASARRTHRENPSTLTQTWKTTADSILSAVPSQFTGSREVITRKLNRGAVIGLSVLTISGIALVRIIQTHPDMELAPLQPVAAPTESAPTEAVSTGAVSAETVSTEAIADLETVEPTADELIAKAHGLLEQAQYDGALKVYGQSLEADPDRADAYWGQCYSLNQLQNHDEAIAACDRALAIEPDNAKALWSKGYALEKKNQTEAALALYDQALASDPEYAEAWNNRGAMLLKLQRSQEAIDSFDRSLAVNPDLAEAWNNRGAALWSLRRFDEAIASIDKAIELQPDYPVARSLREQIRQKLGR